MAKIKYMLHAYEWVVTIVCTDILNKVLDKIDMLNVDDFLVLQKRNPRRQKTHSYQLKKENLCQILLHLLIL